MKEPEQPENKEKFLFREWQEKNKLELRKNKIFNKLFTKRKLNTFTDEKNKSKFSINISMVSKNEEIITNPELYIKTQFDIKNWFSYLFSNNTDQIKEALFLIELFIRLQANEIPFENRVLSRNNYELINCLCHYLNHSDKQISYYSMQIVSNLTCFPNHIEKLIYSEKNLNEIIIFINNNDFSLGYEIIVLLLNCCSDSKAGKYLIDNKTIERITFLINNNIDQFESRYYIYLIRLLNTIIKLFDEYDEYNKEQKKYWFTPLLPFFKSCLKNNYVENPWANKDEYVYYLQLLSFYVNIFKDDVKLLGEIIKNNYVEILIDFYYKLNEDNHCEMMKIFAELLSRDDSINQIFIDEGILGLLINEINRIEYKNNNLLNLIFFACSNIACGSNGQIHQLFEQGLIWKAIDISWFYISQNLLNNEINDIIFNAVYTLNEVILGATNDIKVELIIYQDFLIIDIYYNYIKNILNIQKEKKFLGQIGSAINKLIFCGESDVDKEILNKFRNKFISVGFEDLIKNNIIYNDEKNIQYYFNIILQFLNEDDY
jgi:hypothetical protein